MQSIIFNDEIAQEKGRQKRRFKFYLWVFLACCVLFVILVGVAGYLSSIEYVADNYTDDGELGFRIDQSKEWPESIHGYVHGIQYDATIDNRTSTVLKDWRIDIELPEETVIDSDWCGEFSLADDGHLTITSLDYNETIDGYENQGVGFILYSNIMDNIKSAHFTYKKDVHFYDLSVFILLLALVVALFVGLLAEILTYIRTKQLIEKQIEQRAIINESFLTFANMIDAKDSYTKGHSQRVAIYSRELAKRMGLDSESQERIFYVALLHDIGKIGVTDAILKKNAKLTYDEFNQVKEHTCMGGDILRNFKAIEGIEEGARYHHERYDGKGYMKGLSGEQIPLIARIIAVADAFDAMSSNRCYRNAFEMQHIVNELIECSGKQFDPDIVPHMLSMIEAGVAPILDEDMKELNQVLGDR